ERHRFEVTNATSGFHGGRMNLDFSMKPLGDPVQPAHGRLDTRYERVDLTKVTDLIALKGMRLAGAATGRHVLDWPVGRFHDCAGEGEISVEAPGGVTLQTGPPPGSPARVLGAMGVGARSAAAGWESRT